MTGSYSAPYTLKVTPCRTPIPTSSACSTRRVIPGNLAAAADQPDTHQLVRATVRDTTAALGARWFNITYSSRCKHYAVHDVTYEPNLNRPAVKLTELTRASGSMPPDRHVGPPEAIKRDWGRRQTSLL